MRQALARIAGNDPSRDVGNRFSAINRERLSACSSSSARVGGRPPPAELHARKLAAAAKADGKGALRGADAFFLYDSMGFPLDLTELMAREAGLSVDTAGFAAAMEAPGTGVRADPHCLTNLIAKPELAGMKADLSTKLDLWMKQQGDLGHETEMLATTRQGKRRRHHGAVGTS